MIKKYQQDRQPLRPAKRVVCWFSCGVTSAVATKLSLHKFQDSGLPVVIAYCDTGSEPEDNARFLKDCEQWFGQEILILKNPKYNDIWDVFEQERYLVGIEGARCTAELKKAVRHSFEEVDTDIQVFGFDLAERSRINKFQKNNPEVCIQAPLIDNELSKDNCKELVMSAGIQLPDSYEHFEHSNCIGCVKASNFGYWNKIRTLYPDVFWRMAKIERELDATINKKYKTTPVTIDMFTVNDDGELEVQNEDGRKVEYSNRLKKWIKDIKSVQQARSYVQENGFMYDMENKRLNYNKRIRIFLDELDPYSGLGQKMKPIQCGLFCDDVITH